MRKGFTLLELLVAIALFSILVAIAAGGFTNALRTQREVAALISTQSNAGLVLEQMAREIRTGYLFCDAPGSTQGSPTPNAACQTQCSVINNTWTCRLLDFYNAQGNDVQYSLVNGALTRSEAAGGNPGVPQPITSGNVSVKDLTFTIFGNAEGDHWPPRITIVMGVAPSSNDPAVTGDVLNLQTTVSAREIDCTAGGSC